MEDLLNFLMVFLIRALLKPSFLRQQKTDLEQYPLALTSTPRSSTDHPLNSVVVFKAKVEEPQITDKNFTVTTHSG